MDPARVVMAFAMYAPPPRGDTTCWGLLAAADRKRTVGLRHYFMQQQFIIYYNKLLGNKFFCNNSFLATRLVFFVFLFVCLFVCFGGFFGKSENGSSTPEKK